MDLFCFTLDPRAARALDVYYRKAARDGKLITGRPIRRIKGANPDPTARQKMMVSTFTLGALDKRAKPGESLDQTIFRLAGGIISDVA